MYHQNSLSTRFIVLIVIVSVLSGVTFCAPSTKNICDSSGIDSALTRDGSVIVRTPSGSEDDACQPEVTIPANYTLDVSIVSTNVPKRTLGGPEHKCIRVTVWVSTECELFLNAAKRIPTLVKK